MKLTNNLKLPVYDDPINDMFDLTLWNEANENIDKSYSDVKTIKEEVNEIFNEIPKVNANAEVVDARVGESTLGEFNKKSKKKLDEYSKITLSRDIQGTEYKQGDIFDTNYLKLVNSQLLSKLNWDLRNGVPTIGECIGDSLTYGHDITSIDKVDPNPEEFLPDGTQHVFPKASEAYPEALQRFLRSLYGEDKITIINRGYSGDYCSRSLSRWITKSEASFSIIMLGTNDSRSTSCSYVGNVSEYIRHYEQLIVRCLLWGQAVIIMQSPRTYQSNDMRVQAFSQACLTIANKYGCPTIESTPFLTSQNPNIWSDTSTTVRTHLTGKYGYPLLASGVATQFVGDTLLGNKKSISSGDCLSVREQVDNCNFFGNVTRTEVSVNNFAPPELNEEKSIITRITNGKIAYSFYTEVENMYVIPSVYCFANKKTKLTLDFETQQAYQTLTSVDIPKATIGYIEPSSYEYSYTANTLMNKEQHILKNVKPMLIVRKGWHTLIVESEDCFFSGLEFLKRSEYLLLEKSMASVTSNKYTKLYMGSANATTGTITLEDNISKYSELVIITGDVGSNTLITSHYMNFGNVKFRVGTDKMCILTFNGKVQMEIPTATTIKINSSNDNIRFIYGVN